MEGVTLTQINEEFMLHRQTCKLCGTNGPGVCLFGLKLLTMFHDVILEAIAQEVKPERTMA